MAVYCFTTDSHKGRHEDRNNRPYIAYEYNDKYYVCLLSSNGEYLGQAKGIDPSNPLHKKQFCNVESLESFARNYGSRFTPPLNLTSFKEIEAKPGFVSRRIWRPCKVYFEGDRIISDVSDFLVNLDLVGFNQSFVSINGIVRKLKELFYTVEPNPSNKQVYGYELRNLLLLSSMEVEAAFVGVLSANGYRKRKWDTRDYVKLLDVYDLRNWKANFRFYPDYGEVTPFKFWSKNKPTQSLNWYDAYNKTKHDREGNFEYANFENVINSVCAAVILLYAQFGTRREFHLSDLADISITPTSNHFVNEFYIPLFSENSQSWQIQNFHI